MIAPGGLRPWARNARTHSKKQIRQIADSITAFGFTNPALNAGWDEELLAAELGARLESDFEIDLTGFSIPEIGVLIEGGAPQDPGDPRVEALGADAPALRRTGDL